MGTYIFITIMITICLWFIITMIDNVTLKLYLNEREKSEVLWKIIKHIKQELSLTQMSECPEEELKAIPKELINWIEYLEKGAEDIRNQGVENDEG